MNVRLFCLLLVSLTLSGTENITWDDEYITDILEDISDYETCQEHCASNPPEVCSYFTWYKSEPDGMENRPPICLFFSSNIGETTCQRCTSGPAVCPTHMEDPDLIDLPSFTPAQDLLYLGDSALLDLPSFSPGPALCNIAPFPVIGIQYAVSGVGESLNMVCGGRSASGS